MPASVAGGITFASISGGNAHSCGVTTTTRAYCWGGNYSGELGIGSTAMQLTPMAVAPLP